MKDRPLLLTFLVGTGLILGIRLVYPGLWGAAGAAVTALMLIVLLGLYYLKSEIKQRDRAADDLYYVGLLLTLVSLIYALVALFVLPGGLGARDVQARVDALIGNFGIALVSTVAGILGRILLQDASDEQQEPTDVGPDRLTEETREAIADMVQLRRSLREAADAFTHFTRVTLSHARHTQSHTQELLEDFNQHMGTVAERGLDETAEAWQRVGEAMRQDGERLLRGIEEAVSGAVERTEEAWRSLVVELEPASAAVGDRLQVNEEAMEATLTRLATANAALGTLAGSLDTAQRHVAVLAESASGATAALDANAAETRAQQRTFEEGLRASFEAAVEVLTDAVEKQVAGQTRAWQQAVDDFHAAEEAQRQHGEGAMEATQRTIDALITSLGTAQRDVAALDRMASEALAGLKSRTAEALETLTTLAQGAGRQQEASLRAWHGALSRFSEEARAHVTGEVNAWRELRESLDTSERTKDPFGETPPPKRRGWSDGWNPFSRNP